MRVSGPLTIDAAEWVRKVVEHYGLAPATQIAPTLDLTRLRDLPGDDWLR